MMLSLVIKRWCCWLRNLLSPVQLAGVGYFAVSTRSILAAAAISLLACYHPIAMARPEPDDSQLFERVPFAISLDTATLQLKGELIQGSVVVGKVKSGSSVQLNASDLRVSRGGLFVLGFPRDAHQNYNLTVVESGGEMFVHQLSVAARTYQTQHIEGIAKKIMQPNQQDLQRIRKESALVRQARSVNSDLLAFTERFIWPLEGPITGVYGSQRFYNGRPSRPHFGLDIAAPSGTDVVAPASGEITLVHEDMFYSGGTIVLDHGYGVSSTFIHLSETLVAQGQKVKQGDRIGKVGASGRATGPHLDWRVNWFNQRLDPAFLVSYQ